MNIIHVITNYLFMLDNIVSLSSKFLCHCTSGNLLIYYHVHRHCDGIKLSSIRFHCHHRHAILR